LHHPFWQQTSHILAIKSRFALVSDVVDLLHVDVMDGHFVPNISLGPPVIASLSAVTDLYLDCHLMITDPLRFLEPLARSGADGVTVHIEAVPNPLPVIAEAEKLGIDVGLVINPPTPFEAIEPFLDHCSLALVMSVHPGFGGQGFLDSVVPKIEEMRGQMCSLRGRPSSGATIPLRLCVNCVP
jgi:ribulose-phosphate 3-epimerase